MTKTIFITGGSRGIGEAVVRMLSNQTRAKNSAAIPHARLFGEACYARERIKTQATVSLYRLLGICAYGASGGFAKIPQPTRSVDIIVLARYHHAVISSPKRYHSSAP